MQLPKKYEKFDTKWFAELVDEIEEIKYAIEDVKDGYKKAIKSVEEVESLNSKLEIISLIPATLSVMKALTFS